MSQPTWDNLILDTAAVPARLPDDRFAQWVAGQRIFVSSVMDVEMTPYRDAVKSYLQRFAPGAAVMWETISPQDIGPKRAYLDGVDRSTLFLLLLGSRYGISDDTGYSPTHQEANRATERHLNRLVFTLPVASSARDGKLVDWIRELHVNVSGHSAESPDAVVQSLDARLRDLAARADRMWVKLGNCVFTGRVESQSDRQGARTFTVHAQAFDARVRQALLSINDPLSRRGGEIRLTWPNESYPVTVETVKQRQQFVGEAEVEITCRTPQNWYGSTGSVAMMGSVNGVSGDELTARWTRQAFFGGAPAEEQNPMFFGGFTRPDGPTLPRVLAIAGASGWQAEGIAMLYVVEESARTRGGRFTTLRVGPATASGVPINGQLTIDQPGQSFEPIKIDGIAAIAK